MTTLSQCRRELVAILEGEGITALDYMPEVPDPPCALVTEGDPVLEPGDVFTDHTTRFEVLLIVRGDNEWMTTQLDDLVARAVVAISQGSNTWRVQAAGYSQLTANTGSYLGCRLTCTDTINLTTTPDQED